MGNNQTIIWLVSAVILIGIIVLLVFMKKRENRIRQDIRDNPEKFYSLERRTGDVELYLTCKYCDKKYSVYVDPKDADFVRNNRERCPECDAMSRTQMRNISGRAGWI